MKLLRITIAGSGQLLFLGWVDDNEADSIIDHYKSHYSGYGLLKVEIEEDGNQNQTD